MRIRSSFWAQLGAETFESPGPIFQEVRDAMLQALQTHCGMQHGGLMSQIQNAHDLSELWELRPRMWLALSPAGGAAEKELHRISDMFNGYFAGAISSRFGDL